MSSDRAPSEPPRTARISATIDGQIFEFVVDPECEISIVNHRVLLCLPDYSPSNEQPRRPTPLLGRSWAITSTSLSLTIGGQSLEHEFAVVVGEESPSTLGRDFIRRFPAINAVQCRPRDRPRITCNKCNLRH